MRVRSTSSLVLAALWVVLPAAVIGCGDFEVKGSEKEATRALVQLSPRVGTGGEGVTPPETTSTKPVGPVVRRG